VVVCTLSCSASSPMLPCTHVNIFLILYSLFGDGEGRGYTVHLSFDICQSHHQESAARMLQIFDHRSMSVSHTTRNLWHKCHRFLIIDQCLSVTPQESAARMPQIFEHRSMLVSHTTRNLRHECRRFLIIDHQCLSVTPQESAARMPQIFEHRSMLVSHTTRNLRHECRRFLIIDQCLSVTPPGICSTNATDF
jgi:hypothetical protein